MASILMQERLLGFSLGAALGLGFVACTHRSYWKSTAELARVVSRGDIPPSDPIHVPEPIIRKSTTREELAHIWNRGIDNTLGALVSALSSRGW